MTSEEWLEFYRGLSDNAWRLLNTRLTPMTDESRDLLIKCREKFIQYCEDGIYEDIIRRIDKVLK